ncbi:glycosyltransferase, partial [Methylobacterium radiotolerans]|uniref:glycosyltransferase n=1 Tax=Methylobacterium radiotolerans TaxID=31998 RepID=UPI003F662DAE
MRPPPHAYCALTSLSLHAALPLSVFHAQCRVSGNALATLTRRRLIPGFVRTVHRIDTFTDPRLAQWEERAILDAGRLLCVSRTWAATLAAEYGARAAVVGTGVDAAAFTPDPGPEAAAPRRLPRPCRGPVSPGFGGLPARKRPLAIPPPAADPPPRGPR